MASRRAPLTDAEVVELREAYAAGARQADLARRFGIAQTAVSAMVTGRTRAAAGGPVRAPARRAGSPATAPRPSRRRAPLSDTQAAEIRARVAAGEARARVASEAGVSIHTVHSIMSGRRGGGGASAPGRRLTDAQVVELRERYAEGEAQGALAERFGATQQAVSQIVRGVTYPDAGGPLAR